MTSPAEPLATAEEVAGFLRLTFDDDTRATVNTWLGVLSSTIRRRVPSLDGRIASGEISAEEVQMTLSVIIKRILDWLSRPAMQTNVTYPEYSASFKTDVDVSGFILPEDWLVLGAKFASGDAAYSVKFDVSGREVNRFYGTRFS